MEVHPPEHPIRSVRDFFLHLLTITVGLLIALGLEAAVEHVHNRHKLHAAEMDLMQERHDNEQRMAKNEQYLDGTEKQLEERLKMLGAVRAHAFSGTFAPVQWGWDGPRDSSWKTARDNGAVALMSYSHSEIYDVVYGQQDVVQQEATQFIPTIYMIGAPMRGHASVTELTPEEIATMTAETEKALEELALLRDYSHSLDRNYKSAEEELRPEGE